MNVKILIGNILSSDTLISEEYEKGSLAYPVAGFEPSSEDACEFQSREHALNL